MENNSKQIVKITMNKPQQLIEIENKINTLIAERATLAPEVKRILTGRKPKEMPLSVIRHGDLYDEILDAQEERIKLILALKASGEMRLSELEETLNELNQLHPDANSKDEVEYQSITYQKRFQPVELSPTGKSVKKYWGYWLRLTQNKAIDETWQWELRMTFKDKFQVQADRNKKRKVP